jgi:ketosteroid isomerase-like protein
MTPPARYDDDEKLVHEVIHSFARAVRLGDVQSMISFCAPDLVAFGLTPPLKLQGTEAVAQSWCKAIAAYDTPLDYEIAQLKVFVDGSLALCRGLSRFGGKRPSGEQGSLWMCLTLGLRKVEHDWKIIHQHVSVPFNMETGQALTHLQP